MQSRRVHSVSVIVAVAAALAGVAPGRASAQAPARVTVLVMHDVSPVGGALLRAGDVRSMTDSLGKGILLLRPGSHTIHVEKLGYASARHPLRLAAARDTTLVIALEIEAIETEAVIISSTRGERRIEDEPVRVEVMPREEIEEKLMMTPGDISMLLNETAGLRVQTTSPALGGAGVRIQGLRGRYTQILSDGLPLYGGQSGALGPLQIPPMDLGQVEIIKGVASALYGASALGGVVNLLSRRPGEESERELMLNQSTLGGTDAILWNASTLNERWRYTLLASGHLQQHADVDDDGWADLPQFRRAIVRPRLFWGNGRGASVFVTLGGMLESRDGGTVDGGVTPAGAGFRESLDTRRGDAGMVGRFLLGSATLLNLRASLVRQDHDHGFGDVLEQDAHTTSFGEAALSGVTGRHAWVAGVALQHEDYDADDVPGFDYTHTVPGLFAQDEVAVTEWLTLAGSARYDHHSTYGSFVNPRISALLRPGAEWTVRASAGTGYFAPIPLVEEVEAIGLSRLAPFTALEAERAASASLDVGRIIGPVELNATVFGSRIRHAVQSAADSVDAGRIMLFNADAPVKTWGTELLARYHAEGLHITATHVFTHATEPDPVTGLRVRVPLTPRHTSGIVAAWEQEGRGRVGGEFYYTGRQRLTENPYRASSKPYFVVGFLAERRFGSARFFLNAENIFDARQTRHDPLVLPARAPDGRWLTDVWGPLEGRALNGGVRLSF